MVNYKNSTIYKIVCKDLDIKDCYVGSTTNFNRRKTEHKSVCNNSKGKDYNYKVYNFIRDNGNFDNFDIIEVERYCAIDKNDLHKRERYWFEELNGTLNMCIPNRSKKEYMKEYEKTDKRIQKQKEWGEKNKQYFKTDKGIQTRKEYEKRRSKTDKRIKYNKERNEKLKLDKVQCNICNKEMRRDGLNRHNKNIHNIH